MLSSSAALWAALAVASAPFSVSSAQSSAHIASLFAAGLTRLSQTTRSELQTCSFPQTLGLAPLSRATAQPRLSMRCVVVDATHVVGSLCSTGAVARSRRADAAASDTPLPPVRRRCRSCWSRRGGGQCGDSCPAARCVLPRRNHLPLVSAAAVDAMEGELGRQHCEGRQEGAMHPLPALCAQLDMRTRTGDCMQPQQRSHRALCALHAVAAVRICTPVQPSYPSNRQLPYPQINTSLQLTHHLHSLSTLSSNTRTTLPPSLAPPVSHQLPFTSRASTPSPPPPLSPSSPSPPPLPP